MKVRIVSDLSDEITSYLGGEVVDLPEEKATRFVKAGVAVAADEESPATKKRGGGALEAAALEDPRKRG